MTPNSSGYLSGILTTKQVNVFLSFFEEFSNFLSLFMAHILPLEVLRMFSVFQPPLQLATGL